MLLEGVVFFFVEGFQIVGVLHYCTVWLLVSSPEGVVDLVFGGDEVEPGFFFVGLFGLCRFLLPRSKRVG